MSHGSFAPFGLLVALGAIGPAITPCPIRAADSQPAQKIDFIRDVQPIMAATCFNCHGPDEKARKAKLRLDRAAAVDRGAIAPGKPADSELVRRVFLEDEE